MEIILVNYQAKNISPTCVKQARFMPLTLGEGISNMNIYKEYHKDCHTLCLEEIFLNKLLNSA